MLRILNHEDTLDEHKQVVEAGFQLQDNAAGRKQLQSLIEQWFASGLQELFCAVESTGGYETNWYSFLKNLGRHRAVRVARLNAKGVQYCFLLEVHLMLFVLRSLNNDLSIVLPLLYLMLIV